MTISKKRVNIKKRLRKEVFAMARRFFNGSYSVRAGYHGVRKTTDPEFGTCPQGHIYSLTEIVDDRPNGGFCYSRRVTECPKCKGTAPAPIVSQSNAGALCSVFEELMGAMTLQWRCDCCQKFINELHQPGHLEGIVSDGIEFNYSICKKCFEKHGDDRLFWDRWVKAKETCDIV